MKKRLNKLCSIITLSALLAVSITTYAAENGAEDREAGFQEELETESESVETEAQTEKVSENEKDNGLESLLIIREKDKDEITVRELKIEELKEEIENEKNPELAAVIFQLKEEDAEETEDMTETESETDRETSAKDIEAGFIEAEAETETEIETETEMTGVVKSAQNYPAVTLSELQEEIVYEVAELVPQTVVLTNQCELEDELIFKTYTRIKAVTVIDAEDDEALLKEVKNYDLEKEYAAYLKLQSETKTSSALKGAARTTSLGQQDSETNKTSVLPRTIPQAESETSTTSTPSNREARSTSSTNDTETSTSTANTTQKDVTITLVPDDVYEGDDAVTATYDISSIKELTSGKVTITYDKNVMTYDDADVENCDALEGMMVSVKSPQDSGGTEGKIEIEFSSTTPKKVEGNMVDLWFNLVNEATKGQQFNISLTVDKMQNGSANLTSEVKTATIIAQADDSEDEEETESTAATQPSTTQTPSTTAPTNAPKTGDATNIPAAVLVMMCSAAVFIKARKRA